MRCLQCQSKNTQLHGKIYWCAECGSLRLGKTNSSATSQLVCKLQKGELDKILQRNLWDTTLYPEMKR